MKKRILYMHTLNGKPATFSGDQICYAAPSKKYPATLATSMAQIRRERRATERFRRRHGFWSVNDSYKHVTVSLPR